MKLIFSILICLFAVGAFAQVQFEVKTSQTPIANPRPLLKSYGNQSNTNYEPIVPPSYTAPTNKQTAPNASPKSTIYRIMGDKITSTGIETINLLIEVSKNYSGIEVIKVNQYKYSTSENWEKLSLPPTAYSNKGTSTSQYYNYKVHLPIGEVYFNF